MKNLNKSFTNKIFIILVVGLMSFTTSFAGENQRVSLVAAILSKKLQNDLALKGIEVNITNVREQKISQNEVKIEGNGVCVVKDKNDQLQLRFNAAFNTSKQIVSDIEYDFVEPAPAFAPSSNEEILMQQLMKKISADYGTQNIVIAIDGYEDVSKLTSKKEFTGVGEVRIGDFTWNKIKFDVVLTPENTSASQIVYKLEK